MRKRVKLQMENFYKQITAELRKLAPEILAKHEVQHLLAFGESPLSGMVEPVLIKEQAQCDKLTFTAEAAPMLAQYLLKYQPARQAIVVKPCDSRLLAYYLLKILLNGKS